MTYSAKAIEIGQVVSKIVIDHRIFSDAIEGIGHALQLGNGTDVFAGVRVIAPAGIGKSLLLECLQKNVRHWPIMRVDLPIIATSLKESPSVAQIQDGLLKNFNYGLNGVYKRTNNNEVNNILVTSIIQYKVRAIALDEFQHVFLANGMSVSLSVIDWLKRLMNLTKIPVLLFGTEQLERLVDADPQLITRIPTTIRLHPFKYDEEWIGFLKAFAFKSNGINLHSLHEEFSKELFICTRGMLRIFKAIVVQAVMIAVDDGKGRVEKNHLKLAHQRHLGAEYDSGNPF